MRHDKLIRFYSSWFDDVADPAKGYTAEEQVTIFFALAACQQQHTTDPLDELPATIRRGLQMATMREQLMRIMERIDAAHDKARAAAAARHGGAAPTTAPVVGKWWTLHPNLQPTRQDLAELVKAGYINPDTLCPDCASEGKVLRYMAQRTLRDLGSPLVD